MSKKGNRIRNEGDDTDYTDKSASGPPERIKFIADRLNLSIDALAETLGYARSQGLYDIKNGKTKKISTELALRIKRKCKDINLYWLLTGEGERFDSVSEEGILNNGVLSGVNSNLTGLILKSYMSSLSLRHRAMADEIDTISKAMSSDNPEELDNVMSRFSEIQRELKNIAGKKDKESKGKGV